MKPSLHQVDLASSGQWSRKMRTQICGIFMTQESNLKKLLTRHSKKQRQKSLYIQMTTVRNRKTRSLLTDSLKKINRYSPFRHFSQMEKVRWAVIISNEANTFYK